MTLENYTGLTISDHAPIAPGQTYVRHPGANTLVAAAARIRVREVVSASWWEVEALGDGDRVRYLLTLTNETIAQFYGLAQ